MSRQSRRPFAGTAEHSEVTRPRDTRVRFTKANEGNEEPTTPDSALFRVFCGLATLRLCVERDAVKRKDPKTQRREGATTNKGETEGACQTGT